MKVSNVFIYPNFAWKMANKYSGSQLLLHHYATVSPYANGVTNYLIYPLLMEVVRNKLLVLVILAFI